MNIHEQIASINAALESETNNRKRGYMRLQLRNLEFRLNSLKK